MYPFIIAIDRHVFAVLNTFNQQGYEHTVVEFWYPSIQLIWCFGGTDFVTAEPSYPDMTAPWNAPTDSNNDWDEIPF